MKLRVAKEEVPKVHTEYRNCEKDITAKVYRSNLRMLDNCTIFRKVEGFKSNRRENSIISNFREKYQKDCVAAIKELEEFLDNGYETSKLYRELGLAYYIYKEYMKFSLGEKPEMEELDRFDFIPEFIYPKDIIKQKEIFFVPDDMYNQIMKGNVYNIGQWSSSSQAFNREIAQLDYNPIDRTEECFKKAIELDSKDVNNYFNLCDYYLSNKDFDSALLTMKKAKLIFPNNPLVNIKVSLIIYYLNHLESNDKIIDILIKAREQTANNDRLFPARVWIECRLIESYVETDQMEKAIEFKESVDDRCAINADTCFYIGYAFTHKNNPDYEVAKEYYKKAVELGNHNIDAVTELADIYIEEREYKSALKILKECYNYNFKETQNGIECSQDMEYLDDEELQEALDDIKSRISIAENFLKIANNSVQKGN